MLLYEVNRINYKLMFYSIFSNCAFEVRNRIWEEGENQVNYVFLGLFFKLVNELACTEMPTSKTK